MLRTLCLSLFACGALAMPAPAQGACPINGIQTAAFGAGCGFLEPAVLNASFDASTCSLELLVTAPACCNTFANSHFLLAGASLGSGIPLPPPWLGGCELLVAPFYTQFRSGLASTIPLAGTIGLVGQSVDFQALPLYFTTIGFTYDFGATNALRVQFQ